MKTQISRDNFRPEQRYTGIHQQQGRMITDADWNELVSIAKDQLAQALEDVVGSGAPGSGAVKVNSDRTIVPGDLYIDGLRAQLPGAVPILASAQPDLSGSPDLPATGPYTVYADVWERSVTSLEDSGLLDDGLHGADTCTRTQTMLQVKRCPPSVNPETDIPANGNARLSLKMNANLEAADACDPCAGLVSAGKGRVGNYLFRLEVHDVKGDASDPKNLTLKWSSENGAEQCKANDLRVGFAADDYAYEFFTAHSERCLGVFLDGVFEPARYGLQTNCQPPDAEAVCARRWDGFCTLTHDAGGWKLSAGFDRGVALKPGPGQSPGDVSWIGGVTIVLKALQLTLELDGRKFVAGDFWLAPVREAVLEPGSELPSRLPAGVRHHFLRLARVDKNGVVSPFEDPERRRHSFPRLTNLNAADVGYTAECSQGLYSGFTGNVKQALDKVCGITAADVRFAKPCDTSVYKGQTVTTVAQALAILCDVRAAQISYDHDRAPTFLTRHNYSTVQEAIDALAARPGGCCVTVGRDGMYQSILEALDAAPKEETCVCLCLLPGDHNLPGGFHQARSAGMHIQLCGCGPATRVHIRNYAPIFYGYESICIDDLEVRTHNVDRALLFQSCGQVRLHRVAVFGYASGVSDGLITALGGTANVCLDGVTLEAASPDSLRRSLEVFAGSPELLDLFKTADREIFEAEVTRVAEMLAGLALEKRKKLADAIDGVAGNLRFTIWPRERRSYGDLCRRLVTDTVDPNDIVRALLQVRTENVRHLGGVAVNIVDAAGDWVLEHCDVLGVISVYNTPPADPMDAETRSAVLRKLESGRLGLTGVGTTLRATGCRISRMNISEAFQKQLGSTEENTGGIFDGVFVNDCVFCTALNQFAAPHVTLSSCYFQLPRRYVQQTQPVTPLVARVVAETSIYVGNRSSMPAELDNLTPKGGSSAAANIFLEIT